MICGTLPAGVHLRAWLSGLLSEHLGREHLALSLALTMVGFQLQDWLWRPLCVTTANRAVFSSDLLAYGGQLTAIGGLGYIEESMTWFGTDQQEWAHRSSRARKHAAKQTWAALVADICDPLEPDVALVDEFDSVESGNAAVME